MYQGDIIECGNDVWEILEYSPENEVLEIKVLRCSVELDGCVQPGETYLMVKQEWSKEELWELDIDLFSVPRVQLRVLDSGPVIEIEA
jgi:hypothetical protein